MDFVFVSLDFAFRQTVRKSNGHDTDASMSINGFAHFECNPDRTEKRLDEPPGHREDGTNALQEGLVGSYPDLPREILLTKAESCLHRDSNNVHRMGWNVLPRSDPELDHDKDEVPAEE